MLELVAGLVVAFAALALVLEPLARARADGGGPRDAEDEDLGEVRDSDSPKVQALIALREIEFDRATGKLSDEDYHRLKVKYEAAALAAIEQEDRGVAGPVGSPAGASVSRVATSSPPARPGGVICPGCGPRPEPAPVFCSACGRSLVAEGRGPRCWHCGATLTGDARFCAECGGAVSTAVPA
ncbi:MAG TPA: zinc ribbon domain-containing protein [Gemmatimonadales bacterium]|nr:zinc ribbon domain-containing protein [Gemmatimonadales bacterium]